MHFIKPSLKHANLALRWGLAVTLLWSVWTKFTATEQVAGLFGKTGLPGDPTFVTIIGIILAILALMLIFDFKVRVAGLVLTGFFIVTLIAALPVEGTPAVWKDFALLGGSISLLLWPHSQAHKE